MKLYVQFEQIDFCAAALRSLPELYYLTKQGSAASKIVKILSALPEEQIRSVFDAIPYQDQEEVAAALIMEHQQKILAYIRKLLKKNGISAENWELHLEENQEVWVSFDHIDYAAAAARYMPLLSESILAEHPIIFQLKMLLGLSNKLFQLALGSIPVQQLDSAAAWLINKNQNKCIDKINEMLGQQKIPVVIRHLRAEA